MPEKLWVLQGQDGTIFYAVPPTGWPFEIVKVYRVGPGQDPKIPQLYDLVSPTGAEQIAQELRGLGYIERP